MRLITHWTVLTCLLCNAAVSLGANETPKSVEQILTQFDKRTPAWDVRMESLISIVKKGHDAVPELVQALEQASPTTREFAAQALSIIADPSTRDVLTKALEDDEPRVRIYALRGLSSLGPVKLTSKQRRLIYKGGDSMLRHYVASVLVRKKAVDPSPIRQRLAEFDLSRMNSAKIGRVAPDFQLKDLDGKTYRLSELCKQQAIVLEFNVGDD